MRLATTLRILGAPHLTIAELSEARAVRLKGRVRSLRGETLASPVDGRPCVAYRVAIGEAKRGWIYENYNRINFQIEDDTGSAVVDCGSLGIAGWGNLARRVRRVPVSLVAELVPAAGPDADLVLAESILCDGDPVWVYGAPRLEVDAAASGSSGG